MSGGSYDYAYARIEEISRQVRDGAHRGGKGARALRLAFADLLDRCAVAAHDIEWVDSGDRAPDAEIDAIRACLAPGAELETAIELAKNALEQLGTAIRSATD